MDNFFHTGVSNRIVINSEKFRCKDETLAYIFSRIVSLSEDKTGLNKSLKILRL